MTEQGSGREVPNPVPDPDCITTHDEFINALRAMKGQCTWQSLRARSRRLVAQQRDPTRGWTPEPLEVTTMSSWVSPNRPTLPTKDRFATYLTVSDVPDPPIDRWLAALERVRTVRAAPTPGDRRWWVVDRHRWWVVGCIITLALLASGAVVVFFLLSRSGGGAEQPITAAVTEVLPTTDPCALFIPADLRQLGVIRVVPDLGIMSSCLVRVGNNIRAEVRVAQPDSTFPEPTAATRTVGLFALTEECAAGSCRTSVIPAVEPRFGIAVVVAEDESAVRVRDAIVESLTRRLTSGEPLPPRREPPPGSVTTRPACDRLDRAALAQVAGLSQPAPNSLFGDWSCEWGDPNAGAGRDSVVGLGYSRGVPGEFRPECAPVNGRPLCESGEVEPDKRAGCTVFFPGVEFTASDGEPRIEIVQVVVRNSDPNRVEQVCAEARALATAAM